VLALVICVLLFSGQAGLIIAGVLLGGGWLAYALASRSQLTAPKVPPQVRTRQPIPKAVKAAVWLRCGGVCQHCGISDAGSMTRYGEHLHYDHIRPFSLGGDDSEGNLQLLCPHCNLHKSNHYIG
jgi:5-methylcytosine-specific restriction endonuclease McrA